MTDIVRNFILYVVMPAWILFGFLDYLCHRATSIETTSGFRESVVHAIMGIQVALGMFLGLFLRIDVIVLILLFAVLVMHEVVAHMDVVMASRVRAISIWEVHCHSFLEVIPFVIFGLIVCLKWDTFLDLIRLRWAGQLDVTPSPIPGPYISRYFGFMVAFGFLPYTEELWRCVRAGRRAT